MLSCTYCSAQWSLGYHLMIDRRLENRTQYVHRHMHYILGKMHT